MALEIRVSNLLPLISFATRAGSATQSDLTALQGEVDALQAVTITGGGIATGGGTLAANRVITVTAATGAEAAAGTDNTKAVTAAALKTPLDTVKGYTVTGAILASGGGALSGNPVITVDKASVAEVEAGTIDTKAVTPLGLAGVLASMQTEIDHLSDEVAALRDIVSGSQPAALIIMSHGQSLARRRDPRVTAGVTIADYYAPEGGLDAEDFHIAGEETFTGNNSHLQLEVNYRSFVPLQELAPGVSSDTAVITNGGEGWGSGLGYQFRKNTGNGPMVFFASAIGGKHWRELRPGTGPWGNMIMFATRARQWLADQGELNIKPRMVWTQIEADCDTLAPGGGTNEAVITAAEAQAVQEEVLKAYHHDMSIVFGKDMSALPIYVTPLNSAHYDDNTLSAANTHPARGGAARRAQAGQLAAALANPKIVLLPPHGQLWANMNTDGIHGDGQLRRWYAELAASVIERVEGGTAYVPPHVVSATRSGAVITATCAFPGGGGGVIDTTTIPDPGTTNWPDQKLGVQYFPDGGSAFINVSSVTISGSTLTVTLASTPSGSGQLRIAQLPFATTGTAANSWTPRCCIRDAVLNVQTQSGLILYHWMVPQSVSVA